MLSAIRWTVCGVYLHLLITAAFSPLLAQARDSTAPTTRDSTDAPPPMPPYHNTPRLDVSGAHGKAVIQECQEMVKARLRAPSMAQFTTTKPVLTADVDAVTVLGELEAMNGFGGYDRMSYLCRKPPSEAHFEAGGVFVLPSH